MSNPWVAADVGKVIRLDDSTLNAEQWAGTIAGFVSAGSITLSSAPTITNGDAFQATWETADDACLTAISAAMGNTTALRAIKLSLSIPLAITTTWAMNNWTGEISGTGCSAGGPTLALSPAAPITWFGATPDIPMIQIKQSYGLTLHNLCLIGGSAYPPSAGIDLNELGGEANNIVNVVRDTQIGNFHGVGDGMWSPPDNGQVFVGSPSADITANSITLSAMPSAFTGPGPNQLLEIVDTSAGATEGNEVARTASGYVRGASPITLTANVDRHHTAANTVVLIAQGTMQAGFAWNPASTLNDKNKNDNLRIRDVNVCVDQGGGQATGGSISGLACNQALFGFFQQAGAFNLINPEWEGVGVLYTQTGVSQLVVSGDSTQEGGGASYGPGFALTQQGGYIPYVAVSRGISLFAGMTCVGCTIDESSALNANGDFLNLGNGLSVTVNYINAKFLRDANGALANAQQPTIHYYGAGRRAVDFKYSMISDSVHHVVVTDPGGPDNQTQRVYNIEQYPGGANTIPVITRRLLRGTETMTGVGPNQHDENGFFQQYGAMQVKGIDATQNFIGTACTGGTGGATDYWYRYAWSVNGIYGKVNTTGVKLTCLNAPSVSTPVTLTVFSVRGADTLHLYTASCADPCVDPGTETEEANVPVNTAPTQSFSTNSIADVGVNIGTAMPAVDSTGGLTVSGNGGVTIKGATSGASIITAPAAAGTPTLTLETVTGTVPVIQAQATPGASPTAILRMTGGGPGTANQNSWMPITLSDGSTGYVPIWK